MLPSRTVRARLGAAVAMALSSAVAVAGGAAANGSAADAPPPERVVFSRQVLADGRPAEVPPCWWRPREARIVMLDPARPERAPWRLTRDVEALERGAAWSTDGSTIVVLAELPRTVSEPYVLDPREGSLARLYAPPGSHIDDSSGGVDSIALSDDGQVAAWRVWDWEAGRDLGTAIVPTDGRGGAILPPGSDGPALDALLAELGVAGPGLAGSLDPDAPGGGEVERDLPADLAGRVSDVGWSTDRSRLLYVPMSEPGRLIERDAATGLERDLVRLDDAIVCSPSARAAPDDRFEVAPDDASGVSPDADAAGARIADTAEATPRFELGPIEAGRYRSDVADPAMELTLPAGWSLDGNDPDGWLLRPEDDAASELATARLQLGFSGPCHGDELVVVGSTIDSVVDWLGSRSDLILSAPAATSMGGHPATSFSLAPRPGTACATASAGEDGWQLFAASWGSDSLHEDEVARLTLVDVDGDVVAVLAYSTREGIAGFRSRIAPIIESIAFLDD